MTRIHGNSSSQKISAAWNSWHSMFILLPMISRSSVPIWIHLRCTSRQPKKEKTIHSSFLRTTRTEHTISNHFTPDNSRLDQTAHLSKLLPEMYSDLSMKERTSRSTKK